MQYLIAHIGHSHSANEHITWWKGDSRGYTLCIDKAGLYVEADARTICQGDSRLIAVPKAVAESVVRSTPHYRRSNGVLEQLYDGGPHRVVPNLPAEWAHLMERRLGGCLLPDTPTPFGAKPRALYLDVMVGDGQVVAQPSS